MAIIIISLLITILLIASLFLIKAKKIIKILVITLTILTTSVTTIFCISSYNNIKYNNFKLDLDSLDDEELNFAPNVSLSIYNNGDYYIETCCRINGIDYALVYKNGTELIDKVRLDPYFANIIYFPYTDTFGSISELNEYLSSDYVKTYITNYINNVKDKDKDLYDNYINGAGCIIIQILYNNYNDDAHI